MSENKASETTTNPTKGGARPAATGPVTEEFKPDRTHLLGAAVMTVFILIGIGAAPQYLFWLLIFPILFVVRVLRSRTVVDDAGIHTTYAFSSPKNAAWEDLAGVGFRGSRAFAQTKAKETFSLPGVTFNSLPRLEAASAGRIPDALGQGLAAADDKVRIVYKDGHEVLISKEEYEAMQAEKGESTGENPSA